jgi:hypothetical protein
VRKGDDKIKGLKRAQSDVNLLVRTNPDLVTETEWKDWFDRFNTQMKTVQKLLGEKPAGIDTSSATAKPVEDPNAAAATEAAAS